MKGKKPHQRKELIPLFSSRSGKKSCHFFCQNDHASQNRIVWGSALLMITNYNGQNDDLSIPSELNGHPVCAIYSNTFRNCKNLRYITIPDTVTYVGDNPWQRCKNLTSIFVSPKHPMLAIIDNVLYSKADRRLVCCPAKREGVLNIPQGIQIIGNGAFEECEQLTGITIPSSVTHIGISAFHKSGLTNITISNGVTTIKMSAFYFCTNLKSITLPNSVIDLGDDAFIGCAGLESVTLSESITRIRDGTFKTCTNLTNITIPDNVESIGDEAFYKCRNLTSIIIPKRVIAIGKNAFANCEKLTSVLVVSERVTYIDEGAFSGCKNLNSITIPKSATSISSTAFTDCPNLTITVTEGSYAEQYCIPSLLQIN